MEKCRSGGTALRYKRRRICSRMQTRSSTGTCRNLSFPSQLKSLFFDCSVNVNRKKLEKIHADPPIYLVHDVLTPSELHFIDTICTEYESKFEASYTDTADGKKIISDERTSRFIHLGKAQNQHVRNIEQRLSELVGMHVLNVEPLQIVSYTSGQYFNTHHDAGAVNDEDTSVELVHPYLNSLPDNEGHTEFPYLNLSVRPTRNTAVMFCNILASGEADYRVCHCAKPVSNGWRKYGINIWITDANLTDYTFQPPLPTRNIFSKNDAALVLRKAQNKYDVWKQEQETNIVERDVDVDLTDETVVVDNVEVDVFKRRKVEI